LQHASQCERLPKDMVPQVIAVVEAAGRGDTDICMRIDALLDKLDDLLRRQGLQEVTR
jgi:hypothetical protein